MDITRRDDPPGYIGGLGNAPVEPWSQDDDSEQSESVNQSPIIHQSQAAYQNQAVEWRQLIGS